MHEKAEAVAKMLMKLFVRDRQPVRELLGLVDPTASPPFAPWSWATDDPELATALEQSLTRHGVIEPLRHVGICTSEEKGVIDEVWSGIVGTAMKILGLDARSKKARAAAENSPQSVGESATSLVSGVLDDDTQCHHCCTKLSGERKRCSACKGAYYCDRAYQKEDWKRHKNDPDCKSLRSRAEDLPESPAENVASFRD